MYVKPRQWIERFQVRHREDGTGDLLFHDWLMRHWGWERYVCSAGWAEDQSTLSEADYVEWRDYLMVHAQVLRQHMLERFPWLADLNKDEVHE